MSLQKEPTRLLNSLKRQLPGISWQPDAQFCWSPKTQTVKYIREDLKTDQGVWSLLHEAGHALSSHRDYSSDVELLLLEVEAWENAKKLATQLDCIIDPEHIEDCIDTYRDWLHQRSTCPSCGIVSLQETVTNYSCYNCNARWSVSASRFCRPYRQSNGTTKNRPQKAETAFV